MDKNTRSALFYSLIACGIFLIPGILSKDLYLFYWFLFWGVMNGMLTWWLLTKGSTQALTYLKIALGVAIIIPMFIIIYLWYQIGDYPYGYLGGVGHSLRLKHNSNDLITYLPPEDKKVYRDMMTYNGALSNYFAEYHKYPQSLDELTSIFQQQLLPDLLSSKEFRYTQINNGQDFQLCGEFILLKNACITKNIQINDIIQVNYYNYKSSWWRAWPASYYLPF